MGMMVKRISDTQIAYERRFAASADRLFQAHIDPEAIPDWWGPASYQTRVVQMEPRPGGCWRFEQTDAEGQRFAFYGQFLDLVPSRRLVWTFQMEGAPGEPATDQVSFEAHDDGTTTVRVVSKFASKEALDGMMGAGAEAGMNESWDRLEAMCSS